MVGERPKCAGVTREGKPCRSPYVGDDGYCPAHREGGQEEMQRRGKIGAIKGQLAKGLKPGELGDLESPEDAKRHLRIICSAVSTGQLSHAAGRTCVAAVKEWLVAFKDGAVDQELEAAVRKQLEEAKRRKLKAL